jgi:hypothetical protein
MNPTAFSGAPSEAVSNRLEIAEGSILMQSSMNSRRLDGKAPGTGWNIGILNAFSIAMRRDKP